LQQFFKIYTTKLLLRFKLYVMNVNNNTHIILQRLQHYTLYQIGCWLLAAGCWLLAAGCWLLAAGCWLLAACCWLLAAGWLNVYICNSCIYMGGIVEGEGRERRWRWEQEGGREVRLVACACKVATLIV
jgi:hypothetical protein